MNDQTTIILTAAAPVFLGIFTRYIMGAVKRYLLPVIDSQRPLVQRPLVMIVGAAWAAFGYAMGFPIPEDFLAQVYVTAMPGVAAMGWHWADKKRDK